MSDAPDELESAMILGDPGETVSLDTIKAMARAVRDAGFVSRKQVVRDVSTARYVERPSRATGEHWARELAFHEAIGAINGIG